MPLSASEYWLKWTKNYFRYQFTHVGGLIHQKKMRPKLKALLSDLWPFKDSAWPWERLLPPSQYLSIQLISKHLKGQLWPRVWDEKWSLCPKVSCDPACETKNDLFMVFGWFPWFLMVFGWFPWFFKIVSWFSVSFHGFSRWFHGFSWFLLGLYGFSR